MKQEPLVPELLLEAFNRFSTLETEEEKALFWKELAKNSSEISPEILNQLLQNGVLNLSERVKTLHQTVKKKRLLDYLLFLRCLSFGAAVEGLLLLEEDGFPESREDEPRELLPLFSSKPPPFRERIDEVVLPAKYKSMLLRARFVSFTCTFTASPNV